MTNIKFSQYFFPWTYIYKNNFRIYFSFNNDFEYILKIPFVYDLKLCDWKGKMKWRLCYKTLT